AVIDLPTVDKASAPRVVPLEIYVKTDQGLVVRQRDSRGSVVNEQSLSRAQLPGFIKSLKSKSKGDLSVLIGGDKNARYESVLQVMDELRKHGVQKVGLQVKTSQ
ncbi:MAG TPA: biopolymer transporter ExbD, partial [Burkholderiales bacterium]|nr:biopolymer transporter ExbD [Burkholderiales bacterium]